MQFCKTKQTENEKKKTQTKQQQQTKAPNGRPRESNSRPKQNKKWWNVHWLSNYFQDSYIRRCVCWKCVIERKCTQSVLAESFSLISLWPAALIDQSKMSSSPASQLEYDSMCQVVRQKRRTMWQSRWVPFFNWIIFLIFHIYAPMWDATINHRWTRAQLTQKQQQQQQIDRKHFMQHHYFMWR